MVSANPGGSRAAELAGTGLRVPALSIEPSAQEFGAIDVGEGSAPVSFMVRNTGGSPSGLIGTRVTAMSPFAIMKDGCAGSELRAMEMCTLEVRFSPASFGAHHATLEVSGAQAGSVTASLGGLGRDAVPLTVSVIGPGRVTAPAGVSGKGIDCPGACTESYERVSAPPTVKLTATAGAGAGFFGWSGGCSGSAAAGAGTRACGAGLLRCTSQARTGHQADSAWHAKSASWIGHAPCRCCHAWQAQ